MWFWLLSIVLLLLAVAWVSKQRFVKRIDADISAVCAAPAASSMQSDLPPLLAALVQRSALAEPGERRCCRIEQKGEMRLKPDGPWQSFTAAQVYAVVEPSFVWHAEFALFRVVDSLVGGVGRLEARLFGVVQVMRAEGPETTRAQLQRYLAEVVWVPHAIPCNRHIRWQQLDARTVKGVLRHQTEEVELRFTFDAAGDIRSVEGVRERAVGDHVVPTPWSGTFADYRTIGAWRIPTSGEVQWMLDSGPFCYWRGTVTALR